MVSQPWNVPRARPHRRLAALERRPRDAESRLERPRIVNAFLRAVTQARTQRQALAEPDVVLEIDGALNVGIRKRGITRLDGVERWRSGEVLLRVAEGERAEIVEALVRRGTFQSP